VLKSQLGGPLAPTPVAKQMLDYVESNPTKVKKCNEKAHEQWPSFVCVSGADHAKHGTLITGNSSQHALGQDQHPKTLVDATSVPSNHHFDPAHAEREKKRKAN